MSANLWMRPAQNINLGGRWTPTRFVIGQSFVARPWPQRFRDPLSITLKMKTRATPNGILGSSIGRIEDARFLRGKGSFVDDLELANALHVSFIRSTTAHAKIAGIDGSAAKRLGARVFT